jgi:hypothetical protein
MKKLYLGLFLSLFLFAGCKKELEDRIVGTWNISDTKRLGFGGDLDHLVFKSGKFTFYDNGQLEYLSSSNITYKGSWDIERISTQDHTYQQLHLTAVDFNNQVILTEHYDDINFVSSNHFKVTISSGAHTYVTHFRR